MIFHETDLETEEKVVRKAQRNSQDFSPLYKHYSPAIFNYFLRRLANKTEAEDLASQVFEKALKGLSDYQWQGLPFSAWLFRIARHSLIDYYRRENQKTIKEKELPAVEIVSKEKSPIDIICADEESRELHELLRELPERERKIVYLKFFEGYTNRTISKLTGLTETNVGTIIYRTVICLREKLFQSLNSRPE